MDRPKNCRIFWNRADSLRTVGFSSDLQIKFKLFPSWKDWIVKIGYIAIRWLRGACTRYIRSVGHDWLKNRRIDPGPILLVTQYLQGPDMNSVLIERLTGLKFVNLAQIFCDKANWCKKVCAEEFLLDGSSDCREVIIADLAMKGFILIPAYEARPLFLITLSLS